MKKGVTNGKANGLFGSNDPCTRGQIVTFLWRAAGSPAPKGTAKVPGDVLPGTIAMTQWHGRWKTVFSKMAEICATPTKPLAPQGFPA